MDQAEGLLRSAGKKNKAIEQLRGLFEGSDERAVANLSFKPPTVCGAWPMNAFRLNERLRTQQGVFLICGDISQPFIAKLEALKPLRLEEQVLKIVIPGALARHAIRHLFSMAVSRTTLFPGLDGFAQSLGVYHSVYNPIDWSSGLNRKMQLTPDNSHSLKISDPQ